jgi:hypothetical protein
MIGIGYRTLACRARGFWTAAPELWAIHAPNPAIAKNAMSAREARVKARSDRSQGLFWCVGLFLVLRIGIESAASTSFAPQTCCISFRFPASDLDAADGARNGGQEVALTIKLKADAQCHEN